MRHFEILSMEDVLNGRGKGTTQMAERIGDGQE